MSPVAGAESGWSQESQPSSLWVSSWVADTQVFELSPAACQGALPQEAGSKAKESTLEPSIPTAQALHPISSPRVWLVKHLGPESISVKFLTAPSEKFSLVFIYEDS